MKKKFTLLAAALMAWVAFSAVAEPVKVGNLWYEILDADAKTAEIVAPPDGTHYSGVQNGWFAKSVTIDGETYAVETVGEGAFEGASFSPYANSSGVATFYMIAVPMKVIKKDAFKDITTRSDGNVGIRFTTNVCTGNVSGSSILTDIEPGAFRGAHIRGFVATGSSGGYSHTTAFSNGATGMYNTNTNTIISAPADMRADASMGSSGAYGGYATTATFNSAALEVADYAFWGNTHLKTINMNEGLTTIGRQAFYGMTALQTVNIPSTVTTLATDAFEGCTAISNLTCSTATPPAGVVFDDAVYERIRESGNITVPEGSLDAYQADPNWGKFWNAAPPAAPKMYIAGSFTNWADGKLEMTEDNGTYTITVQGVEQWAEFKFIEENGETTTWYGGNTQGGGDKYGVHPDWCTGIALTAGDAGSNFQVTNGHGDLTFTIDADKKLTITGWAAPANELYLAGSMTNWADNKEALTLDEQTGKFTITKAMEAGAEFKFIDQDGVWIGGDADGNFIVQREQVVNGTELSLLLNGGNNFQIPVAGEWTLTVDKATMKLVISGNWPAPKYAITVAECQNGSVEANKAEAEEGEAVTLTVAPAEGYELQSLTYTVEGADPVAIENNTFNMPAAPVTINATFAAINYTITVAETQNGSVEAPATATIGETVTLTVAPAEGYELQSLTYAVEGADPVAIENNAFQMPAANVTINATFKAINYTITVAEMQNGTVTAPATATIGETVTLTVAPAEGYELQSLTYTVEGADPVAIENNAFQMPAANVTINATFKAINYTITVAETQNGTVEAPATANAGDVVALTVTPAEGYQLKSITVAPETLNLAVEVNENYEFTMPADNVTVTAEFEKIPPVESVITFEAAPANGTVAVYVGENQIESGAVVAEGTQVKVVLTPAEGYEVSTFAVTTAEPEVPADLPRRAPVPFNQGENNTFTFEMPAEPVTITASFTETVITAINDVRAAGDGTVRYIDVNGRVSDKPFQGINIVVDANGNVTKVVK